MIRRLLLPHSSHIPRTRTSHLQTLTLDSGASSATFHPLLPSQHAPDYTVTNHLPPAPPPPHSTTPNSALCPPLLYHRHQTETFRIIHGHAKFFSARDGLGAPHLTGTRVDVVVRRPGDLVVVPPRVWHTFRNASSRDVLVVEFGLSPASWLLMTTKTTTADERFFRNTWSYRDECGRAGVGRSLVQVWLFNYYGGVVGALPGWLGGLGTGWVARLVGVGLNFWGGRVLGELLCGLKGSYEEYFDGGGREGGSGAVGDSHEAGGGKWEVKHTEVKGKRE